ncbi:BamA/TamA family outer membrane protein [Stakelama sp. CBK3Z-3]|uniref:BamA/TamA family outer membrane protein n=1 Tax=Stakelama flava TaxID=2860338 RepID=A0ABS6XK05_9SPHN|nr:BamA/TamA family outer membrane protein [Stakelama flava]MBW4330536.1 BamA/TamA family outer membrane protein [Stakelama flava]
MILAGAAPAAFCVAAPAWAQTSKNDDSNASSETQAKDHPQQAQDGSAQSPDGSVPSQSTDDQGAIIPEQQFDEALPVLSDDINAPLEPMPDSTSPTGSTGDETGTVQGQAVQPTAGSQSGTVSQPVSIEDSQPLPDEGELAQPLAPIDQFDTQPPPEIAGVEDEKATQIAYSVKVEGLDEVDLEGEFRDHSALEDGDGKAANATMVTARAKEDEQLAVRLMQSIGYYDGTAISTVETAGADNPGLIVTITATPGKLYTLGSITTKGDVTEPEGLVDKALPLKVGDPIDAARVQGAEANVSLRLPQQGYPFFKLGDRDILLDDTDYTGAYTLPYALGPRASYGGFTMNVEDAPFDAEHVKVLARFDKGDLYDSRETDDLQQALVATGLFSSVSVEPKETNETAPDGTEYVDMLVRGKAGPARTLAGEAGYGTGEGILLQGSWTHRNLFPPEGALIVSGKAGTQEQGLSGTFRRSNAGKRDRTVSLILSADHTDYDAYEAYTTTLAGRVSYDSTPIWQKKFTYGYGFELVGTNEDVYNFDAGERQRKTYFVAALPLNAGWDTSDSLLNPTKGFRLNANVSPEAAVKGGFRPYARVSIEGDVYYPATDSLVIAGRLAFGTIPGIDRDDLPPSRRYYSGGGGSVRGYGYQELGPIAPDGKPIGGLSFNEFSLEARYRFGNFGIVPFIDGGQAYDTVYPRGSDLHYGAGIGGRFYTNFGPLRVDVATPLNPRDGDPKIALYISIGQAF